MSLACVLNMPPYVLCSAKQTPDLKVRTACANAMLCHNTVLQTLNSLNPSTKPSAVFVTALQTGSLRRSSSKAGMTPGIFASSHIHDTRPFCPLADSPSHVTLTLKVLSNVRLKRCTSLLPPSGTAFCLGSEAEPSMLTPETALSNLMLQIFVFIPCMRIDAV